VLRRTEGSVGLPKAFRSHIQRPSEASAVKMHICDA
jgi:hypothetical protein